MKKDRTVFIPCDCGTHLIQASSWHNDKSIIFAYFSHGRKGQRFSIWWKLQAMWHILTKGTPYGDDIVLSYKEAKRFAKFLGEESK